MMDHHKEESSSFAQAFWSIFVFALLWGLMMAMLNDAKDSYEPLEEITPPQATEHVESTVLNYQRVRATVNHRENTCTFTDTTLFNETVTVIYPEVKPNPDEEGTWIIGEWNSASNTISLMQPGGLNLETVAHEVAHMVDTFMAQRPDLDEHYGVFMQGFWTGCVYDIFLADERDLDLEKFKFE